MEKQKQESLFYQKLKHSFPEWHFLRIENICGRGTPDLFCRVSGYFDIWVELKALPSTNVQIRGDQFAFLLEHGQYFNTPCWVWNGDYKKDVFTGWRWPFQIGEGRKGHVKITSAPNIVCPLSKIKTDLKPWQH